MSKVVSAFGLWRKILHVYHTNLIKHLVAFIENEDLAAVKTKVLVPHKSVQSTGCGDNDMGVGVLVLQNFGILLDRSASVENCSFHVGHVLAETCVLVFDLVSKLTSVAHNQDRCLASDWLDLLESGEDEDCGLTKTRFSLAEDVGAQDGLRDAYLLDCRVNRTEVR
jgi:hypothetical protein